MEVLASKPGACVSITWEEVTDVGTKMNHGYKLHYHVLKFEEMRIETQPLNVLRQRG